jgi:biopolymer transport protein ExbB/TolQ
VAIATTAELHSSLPTTGDELASDELTTLKNKAQNRRNWRIAVEKIKAAAELKWNRKERERLARKAETEAEAARTRSRAQAEAERPRTRRRTTLRESGI